ncbi:MAG: hypothetical protein ACR2P0_13975 [Acidimicrobiales bacterium]
MARDVTIRKLVRLAILVTLLSTSCTSAATATADPTQTTSVAATTTRESDDSAADDDMLGDGDPAANAAQVFDALNAEADALIEPSTYYFARLMTGELEEIANWAAFCSAEVTIRRATVDALPDLVDDIRIDDAYATWRSVFFDYVGALADACDGANQNADSMTGDEYGALRDALFAIEEQQMIACFDVLEALSDYGVLNCERNSDIPPPIDLGDFADSQSSDVDPSAEPSGGPMNGFADLAAGPARFEWFPRPFAIDHSESLFVISDTDYIWFTKNDDTFTFEIYALEELADPTQLDLYEVGATIPFPDDLDTWMADLPVDVIDRQNVDFAGTPATRWEITPDRDGIVEATGDLTVTIAASAVFESASVTLFAGEIDPPPEEEGEEAFEIPSEHHLLWHIETANGPILVHLLSLGFGGGSDVAFAEEVLSSMTFD